jgi:hypothetical protein
MENLFPFLVITKEYFNISATDYQGGEGVGEWKKTFSHTVLKKVKRKPHSRATHLPPIYKNISNSWWTVTCQL